MRRWFEFIDTYGGMHRYDVSVVMGIAQSKFGNSAVKTTLGTFYTPESYRELVERLNAAEHDSTRTAYSHHRRDDDNIPF